MKFHQNF